MNRVRRTKGLTPIVSGLSRGRSQHKKAEKEQKFRHKTRRA